MFAITKDYLADATKPAGTNSNAVGIVGPRGAKLTFEQIVNHANGKKFRMKDDDGELYYEGVYVETKSSDELEPLDCFGEPNAGCTTLEMWKAGEGGGWEIV